MKVLLASGSVVVRMETVDPAGMFSAKLLAEFARAVGTSLRSVTAREKAAETGVLPGREGSLAEMVTA